MSLVQLLEKENKNSKEKKIRFTVNRGKLLELLHQIHLLSVGNILNRSNCKQQSFSKIFFDEGFSELISKIYFYMAIKLTQLVFMLEVHKQKSYSFIQHEFPRTKGPLNNTSYHEVKLLVNINLKVL